MQLSIAHTGANQAAIRAQQITQFFRILPFAMATGLLLGVVVTAVLWMQTQQRMALAWLAVLAASKLWRADLWRRFQKLAPNDTGAIIAFGAPLRLGCLLGGCVWGSSYVLMYPQGDLGLQMIMSLMLVGISAGAMTSMSSDRVAAMLFQLPVLLPVGIRSFLENDTVHHAIGFMIALYIAFVATVVFRLNRHVIETVVMRLHAAQRERDLRDSELRYRLLAHTDAMTHLPNRAALLQTLPDLLTQADANNGRVALFYIDVDNFKDINDSHGHGFGDRFLTMFAERLRSCVRPEDLVARMGGDEFVIAMVNPAQATAVDALAGRLLEALEKPLDASGETVHASASIGVAVYPNDGANIEELLVNSDIALYQAKNRGRGTCVCYSSSMSASFYERRSLELALRQALGSQQLFIEYQPVVRIDSYTPVGLEALVRWRHPERGLLPPGTFIPIAERCGMEDLLGEHVLREVCRQLRVWLDDMVPVVPVAINVSPRQFERGRLLDVIRRVTAEFAIDPSYLHVEITESALMQHGGNQLKTLQQLRELGVRVAIDDFGTGYSSLSYLKNLPIDAIKIDRSFINDMTQDTRDSNIVRAIVTIGDSLAIRVVAEGVETQAQAQILAQLGCKIAQGFLFHRPMAANACTALLRTISAQRSLSDTIPSLKILQPHDLETGFSS